MEFKNKAQIHETVQKQERMWWFHFFMTQDTEDKEIRKINHIFHTFFLCDCSFVWSSWGKEVSEWGAAKAGRGVERLSIRHMGRKKTTESEKNLIKRLSLKRRVITNCNRNPPTGFSSPASRECECCCWCWSPLVMKEAGSSVRESAGWLLELLPTATGGVCVPHWSKKNS